MTLSVQISLRMARKLADYCAKNGVSKSEAVRIALDQPSRTTRRSLRPDASARSA